MVYASEVGGKELTFQVSGQLWNRSLVMRDLETGSLWSHILGECMRGELEGEKLELIPSVMMTWGEWLEANPGTTVLDLKPTADRFRKEFYKRPGQFVYGVKVAGQPQAYSFPYLAAHPVVQDVVGGVPVLVTYDAGSTSAMIFKRGGRQFKPVLEDGQLVVVGSGEKFDPVSGSGPSGKLEQLGGIVSYRRAWRTFYPDSPIAEVPK